MSIASQDALRGLVHESVVISRWNWDCLGRKGPADSAQEAQVAACRLRGLEQDPSRIQPAWLHASVRLDETLNEFSFGVLRVVADDSVKVYARQICEI